MELDYNKINRATLPLFGAVVKKPLQSPSSEASVEDTNCGPVWHIGNSIMTATPDAVYARSSIHEFINWRGGGESISISDTAWDKCNNIDDLLKYRALTASERQNLKYSADFVIRGLSPEKLIEECLELFRRDKIPSPFQTHWVYLNEALNILGDLGISVEMSGVTNPAARYTIIWRELSIIGPLEKNVLPIDVLNAAILRSGARCGFKSLTDSIRNARLIEQIKIGKLDVSAQLSKYGTKRLASIFNQFKPLFLAFKECNENNKHTINQVSRYAKKHSYTNPLNLVESCLLDEEKDGELFRSADWRLLNNRYETTRCGCCKPGLRRRYDKPWLDGLTEEKTAAKMRNDNRFILENLQRANWRAKFEGKSIYLPRYYDYVKGTVSSSTFKRLMRQPPKEAKVTVGLVTASGRWDLTVIEDASRDPSLWRKQRVRCKRGTFLMTITANLSSFADGSSLQIHGEHAEDSSKSVRVFVVLGKVTRGSFEDVLSNNHKVVYNREIQSPPQKFLIGTLGARGFQTELSDRGTSSYLQYILKTAGAIVYDGDERPDQVDIDLSPNKLARDFYYLLLN